MEGRGHSAVGTANGRVKVRWPARETMCVGGEGAHNLHDRFSSRLLVRGADTDGCAPLSTSPRATRSPYHGSTESASMALRAKTDYGKINSSHGDLSMQTQRREMSKMAQTRNPHMSQYIHADCCPDGFRVQSSDKMQPKQAGHILPTHR
jgi:hypothetical protein